MLDLSPNRELTRYLSSIEISLEKEKNNSKSKSWKPHETSLLDEHEYESVDEDDIRLVYVSPIEEVEQISNIQMEVMG